MDADLRRSRAQERGIVLWMTVFIVLVLGGLSAAFLYEGLGEKTAVEHRRTSLLALQICEAGSLRAQIEITSLVDGGSDGVGNVQDDFAGGTFDASSVQSGTHPDRWTIRTTGVYRLSKKQIEVGIRRRVRSDWAEGLYARNELRFNGDIDTDSYDSRLGTYAAQAVNTDVRGRYARTNGHIGSNAMIRTAGSAVTVRGNAIPGPLSTIDSSGTPYITGDTLPRRSEVPLPDVPKSEFEAAHATNDNGNMLYSGKGKHPYDIRTMSVAVVGGTTLTLTGGTYFFTDMTFSGNSILEITGPCTIYVTGQFDIGGGVLVNKTGLAQDLIVYAHPYEIGGLVTPMHSEVIFNGGPDVQLAVYAPEVDVKIGGDDEIWGAVVGRNITALGNPSFHYDEALGDWNKHSTVFVERLYWRDLTNPLN